MSATDPVNQAIAGHQDNGDLAGKHLTFQLGGEEFGVEILKVREIIGLMDITVVPRTPQSIRGVINLRGKIIPVLDLRVKFAMPTIEDTELSCIIVVDTQVDDRPSQMGILVDTVSEVIDITAEEIEPTPEFGGNVRTDFIRSIAKVGETVTILLDIQKITSSVEVAISPGDLNELQDELPQKAA